MVRKLVWLSVAAIAVVTIAAGLAVGDKGKTNDKKFEYAVGLWGDLPYSAVQANPGVPNLIADMNASQLAFTVHDGDLKAGAASLTRRRNRATRRAPRGSSRPRTASASSSRSTASRI
jgi:hypothetical protein